MRAVVLGQFLMFLPGILAGAEAVPAAGIVIGNGGLS
jgi:hypothetical protein